MGNSPHSEALMIKPAPLPRPTPQDVRDKPPPRPVRLVTDAQLAEFRRENGR
jgi:hypothetical protein